MPALASRIEKGEKQAHKQNFATWIFLSASEARACHPLI